MNNIRYLEPEELRREADFEYKDFDKYRPSTGAAVIVMFELGQLGIGCFDNTKNRFYNVNDPFEENINDKWLWTYSRITMWKAIA